MYLNFKSKYFFSKKKQIESFFFFFKFLLKTQIIFFQDSKKNKKNFVFVVQPKILPLIIKILKFKGFFNLMVFVDSSCIDLEKNFFFKKEFKNLKKDFLIFYKFFDYYSDISITICAFLNSSKNKVESLSNTYPALGWSEREISEMFNINFFKKKDSRRLLLDYSTDINPLLKKYPVEGTYEYYYCSLEHQVVYRQKDSIEEYIL